MYTCQCLKKVIAQMASVVNVLHFVSQKKGIVWLVHVFQTDRSTIGHKMLLSCFNPLFSLCQSTFNSVFSGCVCSVFADHSYIFKSNGATNLRCTLDI